MGCVVASFSSKYSEERVRKGADKLTKFLNTKQQGRLDGFFSVKPKETATKKDGKSTGKRKVCGNADGIVCVNDENSRRQTRKRQAAPKARKRVRRSDIVGFCIYFVVYLSSCGAVLKLKMTTVPDWFLVTRVTVGVPRFPGLGLPCYDYIR